MKLKYLSQEIILSEPDHGDTEILELGITSDQTFGGIFKSMRDSDWPRDKTITCVAHVNDPNDLIDFLFETKGLEIEMYYLNEWWTGFIISDAQTIITKRDCYYDVSFDFQGERQ